MNAMPMIVMGSVFRLEQFLNSTFSKYQHVHEIPRQEVLYHGPRSGTLKKIRGNCMSEKPNIGYGDIVYSTSPQSQSLCQTQEVVKRIFNRMTAQAINLPLT